MCNFTFILLVTTLNVKEKYLLIHALKIYNIKNINFIFLVIFQIYFSELNISDQVLSSNLNRILNVNSHFCNNNPRIVYSIVSPEIFRFVQIKDLIETTVLEHAYINCVNCNNKLSDFSIGYFQMKPSFIEAIEKYIIYEKLELPINIIIPKQLDSKSVKKIRLNRLKSLEFQLIYAHIFLIIMEHRFSNIEFCTIEDKIKFYATAYNYNFMATEIDIRKMSEKKLFPWGTNNFFENDNYGDLSVQFYLQYSHKYY